MYDSNITIRIYKNDKEKFKDLVEQDNTTMSEAIREAINKYLNKGVNRYGKHEI